MFDVVVASIALVGAFLGFIFAFAEAPRKIAAGLRDWRIVFRSKNLEDAVEKLNEE